MQNLTLAVEEDLLMEARKLAIEQGTTVNRLVREYLAGLVHSRDPRRAAAARLKSRMRKRPLAVGARTWTRDELYERYSSSAADRVHRVVK